MEQQEFPMALGAGSATSVESLEKATEEAVCGADAGARQLQRPLPAQPPGSVQLACLLSLSQQRLLSCLTLFLRRARRLAVSLAIYPEKVATDAF